MKAEQRGGGRLDNPYCLYCTNPQGELKPREAVREGLVHVFMRAERLERGRAEKLADSHLTRMPAWAGMRASAERSAKKAAAKPAATAGKPGKKARKGGKR